MPTITLALTIQMTPSHAIIFHSFHHADHSLPKKITQPKPQIKREELSVRNHAMPSFRQWSNPSSQMIHLPPTLPFGVSKNARSLCCTVVCQGCQKRRDRNIGCKVQVKWNMCLRWRAVVFVFDIGKPLVRPLSAAHLQTRWCNDPKSRDQRYPHLAEPENEPHQTGTVLSKTFSQTAS